MQIDAGVGISGVVIGDDRLKPSALAVSVLKHAKKQ
jgi:hypothetical protein